MQLIQMMIMMVFQIPLNVTNTSFTDEGSATIITSVPSWTLSGGSIYADASGLEFENNNSTQTFSQNITNFYPDVNGRKIIDISFITKTASPDLN